MALNAISLEWAINVVQSDSDGDLFPKALEIDAIAAEHSHFISHFVGKNLSDFEPGSCRRLGFEIDADLVMTEAYEQHDDRTDRKLQFTTVDLHAQLEPSCTHLPSKT